MKVEGEALYFWKNFFNFARHELIRKLTFLIATTKFERFLDTVLIN